MNIATAPATALRQPLIWLLLGERLGDNAQVLALGKMLGWPYQVKQFRWDHDCDIPVKERGASLIGVDAENSDALFPPWPDIVIAVGQRSVSVSRWIVEQSGGKAINIRLGRPRIAFDAFDLIITTPQYGLPPAPNVRELLLPLVFHDSERVRQAGQRWSSKLSHLPRPWTSVLIGGPTQSMAMDEAVARDLAQSLERLRQIAGGSLLISTSPRTPPEFADILESEIRPPSFLFRWKPDTDNPYLALLELADTIVVTNDSVSMVSEATDFGKPTYLYELPWLGRPKKPGVIAFLRRAVRERRERRSMEGKPADFLDRYFDSLTRQGKARPRRNAPGLDRKLCDAGIVRRLDLGDFDPRWKPQPVVREQHSRLISEIHDLWNRRQGT